MIARLRGQILEALPNRIILDVSGVGYLVHIPLSTYDSLHPTIGSTIELHTHLHIRENAHNLYGFQSEQEKELFLLLVDRVSGIGPSIAIAVLSGMPVDRFKACVVNNETEMLTKIKGLGKKTVERIVLELKDKVGVADAWKLAGDGSMPVAANDTELALIGLGYKQVEARKAIQKSIKETPDASSEELLRSALRTLNS